MYTFGMPKIPVASLCCEPLTSHAFSASEAKDLANAFGALADPIRLRLLAIVVAQDETCSCHLEGPLQRSQPTISHHTRVLSEAGLIIGEKRGRWMYWRANAERIAQLQSVLVTAPSLELA